MASNWVPVAKPTTTGSEVDINVHETLSVIFKQKSEFTIRRIPDVSYPAFFVLSASIILFYVTIADKLQLFVVMEKQRSQKPFITSSKFNSKSISFKVDKDELGSLSSKEKVAWAINVGKENVKTFEIESRGDGLSCGIRNVQKNQPIGEMLWEPNWSESDTNIINFKDLPPNASYTLKLEANLETQVKSLILVSTFTVVR